MQASLMMAYERSKSAWGNFGKKSLFCRHYSEVHSDLFDRQIETLTDTTSLGYSGTRSNSNK